MHRFIRLAINASLFGLCSLAAFQAAKSWIDGPSTGTVGPVVEDRPAAVSRFLTTGDLSAPVTDPTASTAVVTADQAMEKLAESSWAEFGPAFREGFEESFAASIDMHSQQVFRNLIGPDWLPRLRATCLAEVFPIAREEWMEAVRDTMPAVDAGSEEHMVRAATVFRARLGRRRDDIRSAAGAAASRLIDEAVQRSTRSGRAA